MRRLDNDHGGVAIFVAVLLVVLFGMGALVLDVGNMFWERRQLQNGADAAALALAAECVEGNIIDCASDGVPALGGIAQKYADDNASDGAAAVADTDGDGVPDLMAHGDDPEECQLAGDDADNPLYRSDTNAVKVTTHTRDAETGNFFLSHWLAPVLDIDTATVTACAVAAWGDYPGELSTIPLTISSCEYDPETTTTYPGPHRNPGAAQEKILFHSSEETGTAESCNAEAGHDTDGDGKLPGGFGWLENEECEIVTNVVDGDEWVDRQPGVAPKACKHDQLDSLLGTVVQIPVFNDVCRPSKDAGCPDYSPADKYRIDTYASFYLEGFKFGGSTKGGDYSSCTGPEDCIVGYFTTSTTLGQGGGPEGGVIVVELKQ